MDMEVVIEGVSDIVTKQIKHALRRVCKDNGRPGEWRVLMSPSEVRGEWDLGVRGPFGRHFVSFTTETVHLPELVAQHVRACL
jgi:hypothetical protein